jgi:hypothetical protein
MHAWNVGQATDRPADWRSDAAACHSIYPVQMAHHDRLSGHLYVVAHG